MGLLLSIAIVILYVGSFVSDSPAVGITELLLIFFGMAVVLRLIGQRHLSLDEESIEQEQESKPKLKKAVMLILSITVLIMFFVISYRDVIGFPAVLVGTDISIPGTVSTYHLIGLVSPWRPYSLGFYSSPGDIGGLISAAIVLISNGNQAIAQKFYFLCIPIASITMFFLLRRYVSKNYIVNIFGSIIYAYSPVISGNFASIANWGFAFIPVFYISLFEFLKPGKRLLYSALLAVSLLLVYTWHPNFLALLPLIVIVLLFLSLPKMEAKRYLVDKFLGILVFSLLFFLFTYPSFAWDNLFTSGAQYSFSTVRAPPSNQFIVNYAGFTHLQLFLGLESYPVYLNAGPYIIGGLLIPALALMSVLIKPKIRSNDQNNVYKQVVLGSSIILLFICAYVAFLHVADSSLVNFVTTLYKPLVFLRSPLTLLFVATFCYAVLSAFTLNHIVNHVDAWIKRVNFDFLLIKNIVKFKKIVGYILTASLVLSIFAVVFSFTPVFGSTFRDISGGKYGYYENNPDYAIAINWLASQPDFQSFRTVVLPTWPISVLNFANSDPYTLTFSDAVSSYSVDFISQLFNSIVDVNSTHLGTLLALANVKYVAVTMGLNDSTRSFYLSGSPRVYGDASSFPNFIIGDPFAFLQLMQHRSDFKLTYQHNGVFIFENLYYVPRMASFNQCITFESNKSILNTLPSLPLPNEIVSRYALLNYESTWNNELLALSSAIVVDYPNLSSSLIYSESNYSIPIIVALNTNSSTVTTKVITDPIIDTNESLPTIQFGSGTITLDPVTSNFWSVSGTSDQFGRLSVDLAPSHLSEINSLFVPLQISNYSMLSSFSLYMIDNNFKIAKWDLLPQLQNDEQKWQNLEISLSNAANIDPDFNFSNVKIFRLEPLVAKNSVFSYQVGIPYELHGYEHVFNLTLPTKSSVTFYLNSDSVQYITVNSRHIDYDFDPISDWVCSNVLEIGAGTISISISTSTFEPMDLSIFVNTTLNELLTAPVYEPITIAGYSTDHYDLNKSSNRFVVFGDSFDYRWNARSDQDTALHVRANDYANCFIFTSNDSRSFQISVDGSLQHIIGTISKIGSFLIILVLIPTSTLIKKHNFLKLLRAINKP